MLGVLNLKYTLSKCASTVQMGISFLEYSVLIGLFLEHFSAARSSCGSTLADNQSNRFASSMVFIVRHAKLRT